MRYLTVLFVLCACLATATTVCADISESYGGTVYYVSHVRGDDDNHDGRSWTAAKATIQGALEQIEDDQCEVAQIWVSAETSTSTGTTDTYTGPIVLPDGVSLFGGFDGHELGRRSRNWAEHVAVIDGGVSVATSALDGFTIQNSNGYGVTCDTASYGLISHNVIQLVSVGIYCANCASPIIMNNLIKGFTSYGIHAYSGLPSLVDHNTIVGPGPEELPVTAGIAFAASYDCSYELPSIRLTSNIITDCTTGVSTSTFADFATYMNDLHDNDDPGISGQLSNDPQFVDSPDNCRLDPTSPLIDIVVWYGEREDRDLDCNPRNADIPNFHNDGEDFVDIGAYEFPAPPIVDRPLPTTGVNASNTEDRTNIKWGDSDPRIAYGGDFTLPSGYWSIDRVKAWAIPTVPGYSSYFLGDHFSMISLYVSRTGTDLQLWKFGSLTAGSNSCGDPDIRITPVTYYNSEGYLRADGGFDQVWQIDFANVYWYEHGGAKAFAVYGTPRVDRLWFNAASNGSGELRRIDLNNYTIGESAVDPSGWFGGNQSHINVQIFAHPAQ